MLHCYTWHNVLQFIFSSIKNSHQKYKIYKFIEELQICGCHIVYITAIFHVSPIVAKPFISLFRKHSGKTNDMDTTEYAIF